MNINATLIGQTIMFALFVWFCMKFVWPPIMAALDARNKRIADGLAAAERGKNDLALAAKRSAELLREAKEKVSEIIALGDKRASEIVEEAKAQAKIEGDRIITAAKAEVEQEVFRAKEQLRTQVSAIALAGAGKILGREIDAKAHNDLLDKLVAEI
ncbi:MAG: F0F1 ATP synthase subunit B [Candidatus Nitrotoga sp.]|jgi:F-type H+-transporting ATPase subunit b|nr:F0F1 ATP synthase subunit B [Nitrosomonadales bacterium]MDO9101001.1 F0F1 ATP synthase subunit B [Candidatus Nitrotoga sp.]RFC38904.1 MAG: F-type H+-transporting ATPase subunit b [Candidatus Nitrotoga sp. CP45]MDO9448416.1 F0F1 ATP synthase subunit B [Candidatus Nitrotoga sp.]MDP1638926.1 F0F1 ATP synthase subunit B [Candidatus Nitrotoga sp.]